MRPAPLQLIGPFSSQVCYSLGDGGFHVDDVKYFQICFKRICNLSMPIAVFKPKIPPIIP